MYEVFLDGKTLFYTGDEINVIYNAVLKQALNNSGEFEFEVPQINPLYNDFYTRRSEIEIYENDVLVFKGEVREVEETINFTKSVYCVGELSYLFDSVQGLMVYEDRTPLQMLTALINAHNAQVEERKRFTLGVCTVIDEVDVRKYITNYENTLDYMRTNICEIHDAYLRIRHKDGVRYLDLVKLSDYGKESNQHIEFGINMLDFSSNVSATEIVTAVIPLGAVVDNGRYEDIDERLTIKSINSGRDFVYNQTAVDNFGWCKKVAEFNDVDDAETLLQLGRLYLESTQYEKLALNVNAVDLSMLDASIDNFNVGDYVYAVAPAFGMRTHFPVTQKTTYLLDPSKNSITLNQLKPVMSYTDQISSFNSEIVKTIPSKSNILAAAKNNASELIKNASEGNVYTVYDEDGKPIELCIIDDPDLGAAQKVWRWNMNGLGYSKTGYEGEYGLAITMDGQIVADYITTGTMHADRIRGGTLTLGGLEDGYGLASVRDKDNKETVRLDKEGIYATAGEIGGFTIDAQNLTYDDNTLSTKLNRNGLYFKAKMDEYSLDAEYSYLKTKSNVGEFINTHTVGLFLNEQEVKSYYGYMLSNSLSTVYQYGGYSDIYGFTTSPTWIYSVNAGGYVLSSLPILGSVSPKTGYLLSVAPTTAYKAALTL